MRKRLLAIFLIGILSLTGCDSEKKDDSDKVIEKGLPDMTREDIEITYVTCQSPQLMELLAKQFEKIYPNIDVEVIYIPQNDIDSTMYNMLENGETIDCFDFYNCDKILKNGYLYDMTEFWENDEENANLIPSVEEAKLGYFGTDRKWATPTVYYPDALFVEKRMVKKAGLDMPDVDWTWNEMIEFAKSATKTDEECQYYGLCEIYRLDMYYDVSTQLAIGPYGYDGSSFDFTYWSDGVKQYVELKDGGFVTPDRIEPEISLCPPDIHMFCSGEIAILAENFYSYIGYLEPNQYDELEFVPYIVPAVKQDSVKAPYTKSTMIMSGIMSSSKYQREAYELLKYMGWGVDGWKARLEIYKDLSIVNATGTPLYQDCMPVPITLDEEIWTEYKKFYYNGVENIKYWDYYFDNCIGGIPDGISTIPGYSKFHYEYFGSYERKEEFYKRIDNGEIDIDALAVEMEEKLEKYYAEAMLEYFDIDISQTTE